MLLWRERKHQENMGNNKNNTIVVSNTGNMYLQQDPQREKYKCLLENISRFNPELVVDIQFEETKKERLKGKANPKEKAKSEESEDKINPKERAKLEEYGSEIYFEISKRGGLVLGFLHNAFSFDTNHKVLYVPKNILENKQQLMILDSILKEYETMRDSNINTDISLTIYVDGVFLKRLSKDSWKWNGDNYNADCNPNGDKDYSSTIIMSEIKNRIKSIEAKASER